MDDNTRLVIVLEAQAAKLQRSLVQTNRLIDRFAAQTERRFEQMNARNSASFDKLNASMRTSLGGLNSVLGPVIGTLGVREIIRFSDAWTEAGNKIAAAAQVSGQQARSLDELKNSANDARQEFGDYVDLYARLLRVSPNVAATELEVARATDIVAKSLKAGGASAQEQTAALIQLGQAIGSGFLQGDELRSLRENAPLLAKAIAEEFGVTIGELKELGAEGKITSDRVFKAILKGGADIEAAFNATQSTIKDAFTRINNEFTAYIGTAGVATGATQGLIDALNYVAEHFAELAPVVANFAAILAVAFAGRLIIVPIVQATVALGGFLAAMASGTLTAVSFSAALGPIAILAGAAAAAYALMVYAEGDAARAADAHTKAIGENQTKLDLARDSSDEFRAALQKQIAVQLKAAAVALGEARAQAAAARVKAQAQADYVYKVDRLMGVSDEKIAQHQKEYWDAIVGDSETRLGQAETAFADLLRQFKEIDAIRLTPEGTGDRPSGTSSGGDSGSKPNEYEKALEAMRKRTANLQAETAAQAQLNPLVNDYGFALERARAEQELLNAAKEAGLIKTAEMSAATPKLRSAIDQLAAGYAQATVEAAKLAENQDKVREAAQFMRDTLKDATSSFIQDLLDGKTAAEALSNALVDVGNRLIGLGLGTLFGKGDSFGLFGKLFGFASGGYTGAGGKHEPAGVVHKGEYVFDQEATRRIGVGNLEAMAAGRLMGPPRGAIAVGGSGGVTVDARTTINAPNADAAGLARLEAMIRQRDAELPSKVIGAVRRAKLTRQL